ncbi:Stage V sporulation protein SpoVM, partial [Dysosmobacter welbionis]
WRWHRSDGSCPGRSPRRSAGGCSSE